MDNDQANLDNGGNSDQNNGGGNTPPAWTAQLDKDLQGNERLTQFKTIGEMGKAFLDTEGKLQGAITIPGENATDEERAAFYTKMGRPEQADKYSITKPTDLPDTINYSPEVEAAFKEFAFKNGMSDAQAKEIYSWYWGLVKDGHAQQEQAIQQANETAVNKLKDEWKGDAFKVNTELATRAFKKFGGDSEEVSKFITESKVDGVPLGNHPVFLKVFAAIGKAISDSSLGEGGRGGGNGELSDEDKAKARFPNTNFQGG